MTNADNTKQAAAHTPEPWHISGHSCRDYEGAEIGTGNKTVAVVLTADAVEATQEERANARRIVAAVNACEGIRTEALEQAIVRQLVEALEGLYNWLTPDWQQSSLGNKARAAIAKATGRQA
jgi:hypothetical protein